MYTGHERHFTLERVAALRPQSALDVGCGYGATTVRLSPYCGRITAIDLFDRLIERCRKENQRPNITYSCMDARDLKFPDKSFELVLENNSLHHIINWEKAVHEMIRVSAAHVLIEEPIDDLRNDAKRAASILQDLMLEIQAEVGYPHNKHLSLETLLACLSKVPVTFTYETFQSDETVGLEKWEAPFRTFAAKTQRESYWLDRFAASVDALPGNRLCKWDKVFIIASRNT